MKITALLRLLRRKLYVHKKKKKAKQILKKYQHKAYYLYE